MKRSNKNVVPISIKNKTYYINILLVDTVGVKNFKIEKSYDSLDKNTQSKIREYIRQLIVGKDKISTSAIEDEIFLDCLNKNFRGLLLKLNK